MSLTTSLLCLLLSVCSQRDVTSKGQILFECARLQDTRWRLTPLFLCWMFWHGVVSGELFRLLTDYVEVVAKDFRGMGWDLTLILPTGPGAEFPQFQLKVIPANKVEADFIGFRRVDHLVHCQQLQVPILIPLEPGDLEGQKKQREERIKWEMKSSNV